jgi:uncharacterized membrane protein (DUF2068 family)
MNPPPDLPTPAPRTVKKAIRLTAYFEALKGAFVLLAAAGLLSLPTADLYTFALKLVEHAHLNPAAKYPDIFLNAAKNMENSKLVLIALGAIAYSTIRFVEAYGLFRERTWAEVLAAVSATIYLPFELVELVRHPTIMHAALLIANSAVVYIMVFALSRKRANRAAS